MVTMKFAFAAFFAAVAAANPIVHGVRPIGHVEHHNEIRPAVHEERVAYRGVHPAAYEARPVAYEHHPVAHGVRPAVHGNGYAGYRHL
ncbi:hypothetical protein H4R18_000390 [Coemansia javaensis]|uniref:Uncharacterized protein n=1 Tax=Coemansia javaensis TaxID=2761396 RepID=A0A9W8LMX5_9FUNG|nr:hypothetical protein H4R18_000390 [Coemansia javaensis]